MSPQCLQWLRWRKVVPPRAQTPGFSSQPPSPSLVNSCSQSGSAPARLISTSSLAGTSTVTRVRGKVRSSSSSSYRVYHARTDAPSSPQSPSRIQSSTSWTACFFASSSCSSASPGGTVISTVSSPPPSASISTVYCLSSLIGSSFGTHQLCLTMRIVHDYRGGVKWKMRGGAKFLKKRRKYITSILSIRCEGVANAGWPCASARRDDLVGDLDVDTELIAGVMKINNAHVFCATKLLTAHLW